MQAIAEKELPERERMNLVKDVLAILQKNRVSFRQACEILQAAQDEMEKLPLTDGYSVTELLP